MGQHGAESPGLVQVQCWCPQGRWLRRALVVYAAKSFSAHGHASQTITLQSSIMPLPKVSARDVAIVERRSLDVRARLVLVF